MKKVWKSVVATLAVTTLSLGLLPGNLAESAGLAVESKAANGYQIVDDPYNVKAVSDMLPSNVSNDEIIKAFQQALNDKKVIVNEGDVPQNHYYYIFAKRTTVIIDPDDTTKGMIACWAIAAWKDPDDQSIAIEIELIDDKVVNPDTNEMEYWPCYYNVKDDSGVHANFKIFLITNSSSEGGNGQYEYSHTHNYSWVVDMDASMEKDGEALYRCSCGDVKYRQPIPASEVYVKNLYGEIRFADQGATVTFDAKKNSCISDYIIGILAQRSDVTTTITFEYKNAKYQFTIPAGTDFTSLLNDDEKFYGFFGFCGKLGIPVNQI